MPVVVDQAARRRAAVAADIHAICMVAFRGNTTAPFDSNVAVWGPGSRWGQSGRGKRTSDVTIGNWRADAVYVVLLAGHDSSADIAEGALVDAVKFRTAVPWQKQMIGLGLGRGRAAEPQRAAAARAIGQVMLEVASVRMRPLAGEDRIGQPQRVHIAPGKPFNAVFYGASGHHVVSFTASS